MVARKHSGASRLPSSDIYTACIMIPTRLFVSCTHDEVVTVTGVSPYCYVGAVHAPVIPSDHDEASVCSQTVAVDARARTCCTTR